MDYIRWNFIYDMGLDHKPLILASKSPRRKYLLELAGIPFEIQAMDTDESFPSDTPIPEVPAFIARKKAQVIYDAFPERCLLAADTVVVLGNEILGKPENREDAIRILQKLSGNKHEVITGVVMRRGNKELVFSDHTLVYFHSISYEDIVYYVDQFHPYDKAGAYAIQEWIGAIAIRSIDGCFYNVMGLPVSRVVAALRNGF